MKQFNILIGVLAVLISCQNAEKKKKNQETATEIAQYASFGAQILAEGAKSETDMLALYQNLPAADTVDTKFSAKVTEVCQAKGCWMKLELEDGTQAMVRFKDYAFFMPKDISGREVIVDGKAFVDMMSVEDQRHYAEDEGKSEEEIAAITQPKKTFSFEASGVLIKQ
ncbi:DUF4920 domain-containing protein [Lentiprolixibacter aurantiacus]|uniref:DUF4920 domain-containing protein n=1 Tax=Lentiprolixibacter aurantiacus TaxID=2993939 RepID=A0AAE3SPB8_9FLAO|nr:DUF4920 domain-containing protein [Lentiprolixibacter aurantiacus]MCX2720524.1 DUF4920 domain-containing protein [Lentiprolixibacter aurantiacus]